MAHFLITFKTEENNIREVVMNADHASEAIDNVRDDYEDVEKIISCKQISKN